MAGELDKLDKLWPDRQIFQGSAGAYIIFSESSRMQIYWDEYEKPLWDECFDGLDGLEQATVIDIGSATGRLIDLLLERGVQGGNILAMEPNPLLSRHLTQQKPGLMAVLKDTPASFKTSWMLPALGVDLITASMVVNHLATAQYDELVEGVVEVLLPGGYFTYSVPEPQAKARKHGFEYMDTSAVAEEDAPWGGLTRYYHRPYEYQMEKMTEVGLVPEFIAGGYDNSHHMNIGPKRLLFAARKP